jgi:hypothetical protein
MSLLNAMGLLAAQWDEVLGYLSPDQASALRGLVTRFVAEADSPASSDIAESIMTLLVEVLPVTHPVLGALMLPEERFRGQVPVVTDPAWPDLAASLRLRLAATAHPGIPVPEGRAGSAGRDAAGVTEIAVDIYLDTDDRDVAARVFDATDSLVRLLGFDGPFDEQVSYGSIFRRATAVARQAVTNEELLARLIKAERALELRYLERTQAEVDVKQAEAAQRLIGSLAEVPQACLRAGSLLLLKYQDAMGPVVLCRTLSQLELHALERYPEIQKNPRHVLDALATAVASGGASPAG